MEIDIQLTNTILDNLFSAGTLYERLSLKHNHYWISRLKKIIEHEVSASAISDDDSTAKIWSLRPDEIHMREKFDSMKIKEVKNYSKALSLIPTLFKSEIDERIFHKIVKIIHEGFEKSKTNYRFKNKRLRRAITEKGEIQTREIVIKTSSKEIEASLKKLADYINAELNNVNPFILSGIAHFIIAKIHPFEDGNGRLARIFEKGILYLKGYDYNLFMMEDYYLINSDLYYELLNKTIQDNNLVEWLEFYAKGILFGVKQSEEILYFLSGGTIDLINKKIIETTERETQSLDLLNQMEQASAADIGKKLKITRQSANFLIKNLLKKKLLKRIGESTSVRYRINFHRSPALAIYKY